MKPVADLFAEAVSRMPDRRPIGQSDPRRILCLECNGQGKFKSGPCPRCGGGVWVEAIGRLGYVTIALKDNRCVVITISRPPPA